MNTWSDLALLAPEGFLVVSAAVLLMTGRFHQVAAGAGAHTARWASVALLITAVLVWFIPSGEGFAGGFVVDSFARTLKIMVLVFGAGALALSWGFQRGGPLDAPEFAVLVLFSVVGMMAMVSARDLLIFFLGLELQSMPLYALAAFHRDSLRSTEAALKYFLLGAVASALALYGASMLYGFSGGLSYAAIAEAAQSGLGGAGLSVGLALVVSALAFKIAAAPFHMWTPDVYEGAPAPAVAFFAGAPKIAAMAALARFLYEAFPDPLWWRHLIAALAALSMAWGAVAAVLQRDLKRLLAYSAIAHMGYALAALAAGGSLGARALVLYLIIYGASVLAAFGCVLAMRRRDGWVSSVDDLAGLAQSRPWLAAGLAATMFSLAGVPPLAGFFAKLEVLRALVDADLHWLAIWMVLASALAAFYYLRVVRTMFFDPLPKGAAFVASPLGLRAALSLAVAFVSLFMLVPALGYAPARWAAHTLGG